MTDRILVLVRHGQSEWNLKNLFTGWKDVDLTEQGIGVIAPSLAHRSGKFLPSPGAAGDLAESHQCFINFAGRDPLSDRRISLAGRPGRW